MSRRCNNYFLCDARIQESLSEGGGGGATAENNIIFNTQLILQFYRGWGRGPTFFRGVQLFPGGGGGVQMLISIK